jgi:hypothetical protein
MFPSIVLQMQSRFGLNVNAKEFKPKETPIKVKLDKIIQEKIVFDKLEDDFINNNFWLFDV